MAHKAKHKRKSPPINIQHELNLIEQLEQDLESLYLEDDSDSEFIPDSTEDSESMYAPDDPYLDTPLSEEQYRSLFINPYNRFLQNEPLMGHALIDVSQSKPIALQYTPPVTDAYNAHYTKINNIRLFQYQGKWMAEGVAEDGTKMIANRQVHIKVKENDEKSNYQLFLFSPVENKKEQVQKLGSPQRVPLFKSKGSSRILNKLKALFKRKPKHKGGKVTVDERGIDYRSTHKRNPKQKKVMGKSAYKVYHKFYQEYQCLLSPEMKSIMEYTLNPRNGQIEWTHAIGYGLSPLSFNPQTKSNLVAGPEWLNTKMNLTERALRWHTLYGYGKTVKLKCILHTLPGSDVLDHGEIKGKIVKDNRKVTLKQVLDPWVKEPNLHPASDIAQTVLVSQALIEDRAALIYSVDYIGDIDSATDLQSTDAQQETGKTRAEMPVLKH